MLKARLMPAMLVSLSLLMQGCVFDDDDSSGETSSLLDDGGASVVSDANGDASITDEATGLTVTVNAASVTGLAEGDSFTLEVVPVTDTDAPQGASTFSIAGQVFNIKIKSVNTGAELQPGGGMQITLPYGSSVNGTEIQKLAIANYHEDQWILFRADSVNETNKTVTATLTKLSPVTVVVNNATNSAPVAPDYSGTINEANKTVTATLTKLSPVTVVVNNATNSAPVAPDYSGTISEGGIFGVKLKATDIDGDALTYSWLDGTTGGKPAYSAGLDAAGNFNYQPSENFNGETKLYYKVSDGELSATGSVYIKVLPVNDAPVANTSSFDATGNLGTQGEFSVTDPDGDTVFTFTIVTQPEHGTVTISGNTYTYTPDANYDGEDSFEFTVSDGKTTSSPGTVNVSVTPNYRYVLEGAEGDGTSWNNATSSVQSAVNALVALGGGRVLIGPGTFYADAANTPVASIPGDANVELYGGFNGYNLTFAQRPEYMVAESVLSGDFDQSGDFSEGDSPNVIYTFGGLIDGLTISGGNGTRGAGIFVNDDQGDVDGSVTLNHVTVSGNQASEMGGGIYALRNNSKNADTGEYLYDAYLVISNSTISDNTAPNGGGIYNVATDLQITDSEISGNAVSDLGGGIYSGGEITIANSVIRENTQVGSPVSWAAGGGIFVANFAVANITGSQIDANESQWGAGLYLSGKPAVTIDGSSVSYNEASSGAGGIYNEYARLEIRNSHLNHNTAVNTAGGIYNSAETDEDIGLEEEGSGEEGSGEEECGEECGMISEGFFEGFALASESEGLYDQCDSESEGSDQYIALDCDTVYETYETCDDLDLYLESDVATFNELACESIDPDEWTIPDLYQSCPNDFATLIISDSEMVGNVAGGSGGALYDQGATCIEDTSFRDNQAYRGGAIENTVSDVSVIDITNSTFVGNQAVGSSSNSSGGAMFSIGYTTNILRNVVFSNNSAESTGGALYFWSNITTRISNFSFFGNTATDGQDIFIGGTNNSFNYLNMSLYHGCSEQDIADYASNSVIYSNAGNFANDISVISQTPFVEAASGEVFFDQTSGCANAGDADTATGAFNSLEAWSALTSDMENSVTQESSGMTAAGNLYDPADTWIKTFSADSSVVSFTTNQTEPSCALYADGELVTEEVLSGDAHNQSGGTELTLLCASAVSHAKSAQVAVP